jgi:hypothetical protein
MGQAGDIATRFARANGINLAYRVRGEGPWLVLIMGYRLPRRDDLGRGLINSQP